MTSQQEAIQALTRTLRHMPTATLRRMAASVTPTTAAVARALLDTRTRQEPPPATWPGGKPERSTTPVSNAQEIGARLIQLSQSNHALSAVQEAQADIQALADQALNALGATHPRVGEIQGPASAARDALNTAMQMVQALLSAMQSTGDQIAGGS